jgi:hypothetical protein
MGRAVVALAGATLGALAGLGLGFGSALAVRVFGSSESSLADLGVAAFSLVVVAPLLAVAGALIALRLRTGHAVPRPLWMTTGIATTLAVGGALLGSGVFRWSLAVVGVAVGIAFAAVFDREAER